MPEWVWTPAKTNESMIADAAAKRGNVFTERDDNATGIGRERFFEMEVDGEKKQDAANFDLPQASQKPEACYVSDQGADLAR